MKSSHTIINQVGYAYDLWFELTRICSYTCAIAADEKNIYSIIIELMKIIVSNI